MEMIAEIHIPITENTIPYGDRIYHTLLLTDARRMKRMKTLALLGGKPVVASDHKWTIWLMALNKDERLLIEAARAGEWLIGSSYAQRFADVYAKRMHSRCHDARY